MNAPLPAIEVTPRDLSAYRAGNTGIDYVHRFESGKPGPHVMINALTHGNEFCGMVAVCHLLDSGVRPKIGTLTLSFANVAAYETFDPAQPFESRLITHNLNRIWSSAWLDGAEDSVELRRAREMRPAVAAGRSTSSTSTRPARTSCRSGSTRRSRAMPRSPARCRGRACTW